MMFYKETNFKETPIGKIPKEWEVVKVAKFVNVLKGFAFSSEFFNESNEGIPLIRIRDLGKDKTESYYSGTHDPAYVVRKGDILVSMDGEFNAYIWDGPRGLLNQRVCKVWSRDHAKLGNLFLYYGLQNPLKIIETQTSQTTVKHLLDKDIEKIKIPLPPHPEQQKIAEILSIVDEAIQKTDEVIAKTERLKKGLMQELLTKGIGHKEFKDTEIGRIPKDWEVTKLGDKTITKIVMGQSPPSSKYNKEGTGLPFLQGKMEFREIYPLPIIYCSEPIKIAKANDILLSVRAPVGDVNLAPFKLCIGRGLAAIRFNDQIVNYLFYFYYLQKVKKLLETLGKGSTFKAIVKADLENLRIPLPRLQEQQRIAEILSTVDEKLELERNEKAKLERIKQGLMDLLLTGKIRVRVN
ncbi:MAG: restriction endonuclease subunit S [archaeon]|nr:restriction endonuclease subunit S [archaeon]MCP8314177.1 restriction endonuclease subunit S [archaeon]